MFKWLCAQCTQCRIKFEFKVEFGVRSLSLVNLKQNVTYLLVVNILLACWTSWVKCCFLCQVHTIELAVLDRAQQRQAILAEQLSRQSPDLTQNSTRLISSVEMTPPEDNDAPSFVIFPDSENFSVQLMPTATTSSVFMSP